MEKMKTIRSSKLLVAALVCIVAVAFSSFTLWLLESSIKYVLFVFEIAAIVALFVTINGHHINVTLGRPTIERRSIPLIPDIALIFGSLSLILLEYFDVNGGLIQLLMSLVLTAFLSGYAFLNILGMNSYFSRLELFVLSNVVSYLLSGFVFLGLLIFDQTLRFILLCSVFLFLGLLSMAKHLALKNETSRKSLSRLEDLSIIVLAVAFYLIIFVSTYPGTALVRGLDVVQHFAYSITLTRTPALYYTSFYVLYHSFEASLLSLSGWVDVVPFLTALGSLVVMLPLAFYITAKEYLEHIDNRLPSVATLFWCLFQAGYGWIYFTFLKANSSNLSQLELLVMTSDKTYYSTIYGIFGNFFVPQTVVFAMMLVLFFLLKRKEVPSGKFIVLFSLLVAAMFLTHVAEASLFVFFIALLAMNSKDKPTRIADALRASIIGFLLTLVTYVGIAQMTTLVWTPALTAAFALPMLLVVVSIICRRSHRWWDLMLHIRSRINSNRIKSAILLILVFLYCLALLAYPYLVRSFSNGQISKIFSVPWFFYPLALGVSGSLAVIGLIYIFRDEKLYSALSLLLAFAVFAFVTGRAISFINLNFPIGFFESRFIPYLLLPIALVATIALLKFKSLLDCSSRKSAQRMLMSVLLVGLLVVGGASTTFLNIEYRYITANGISNKLSTAEIEAYTFLRKVFDKDSNAFLVTITSESLSAAEFSAPAEAFRTPLLYSGYGPEITLPFLYVRPAYSHGYLYMHDRDFEALHHGGYDNRYFAQHLIPMLPIVFENSEVTVYNVSRIAPPLPLSDQILLFPFNPRARIVVDENLLFAFDMLSQGLYNYTTAFDLDNRIMSASTLLLSFDPKEGDIEARSIEDYTKFVNSGGNLIIVNTNGFGTFAERLFISSNSTFEADSIEGISENLTLPTGIIAPRLKLASENGEILSSFVSSNEISPYITRMNIGEGQLFYVNAEPLTRYMSQTNSRKSDIYKIIGKLLNCIKLRLYEFPPLSASDGYVKEIYLDKAVSISTTSILFPSSYPEWVDDGDEKALRFDGDGDYLEISNPSNLDITNSLSIFAWVKTTKDVGTVFAKYYDDDIKWPGYAFGIGIWEAGNISYWTDNYGNWVQGDSKVNDGSWHYVGITHSGSTATFYKDGIYDGTQSCQPRISNGGTVAWIGRDFEADSRSFEGLVKGIRVYNRSLSSAEVFDLYNGTSVDSKGLVLHLPMDEGFGSICHDISGENNNAKWQNVHEKDMIQEIRITSADGISVFYNLTSIQLSNYSKVTIQSSEITIKDGKSFYAQLGLNKTSRLDFTPNAHLTATSNGGEFEIANISTILVIMDNPITLWARTPAILANGGTFKEVYSQNLGINGEDLVVRGEITLDVAASDSYSSLNNFQINGSYESSPQSYYDELESLRLIAIPACILAVLFTCIWLSLWLRTRANRKEIS